MMDTVNDPDVERIVIMSAAQIGKTECLNNILGYLVEIEPGPILIVYPTVEMGQAWSKDRLSPMFRDTPSLKGKMFDYKSPVKIADSTILHKIFPGGHLTITGANSAASLAARPIRIVLGDEIDRYPLSVGAEGDPLELAFKRTTTFWNRKEIVTSTPTVHGISKIEQLWDESDKRYFYVPCPHCNKYQPFHWRNMKWDKDKNNRHLPETAYCKCEFCKEKITNNHKLNMLLLGEWRATQPFKKTAGFHLNEMYSPWVKFGEMVAKFLKAKKNRVTFQTFVNTSWGETWKEGAIVLNDGTLYERREKYNAQVPEPVVILTAGIDMQDDRIEVEVVGWGKGEESWSIDYKVFHGDPSRKQVWKDLDDYIFNERFKHKSGLELKISCSCIDTGGHHTQRVYAFVKPRQYKRLFAIKGSPLPGKPVMGKPSVRNKMRVKLFPVGTDTAKELIYGRLKNDDFSEGYMHFPDHYDLEYFAQLTAEQLVSRYRQGKETRVWVKKRERNEALDCRVYALAALYILNANLGRLSVSQERKIKKLKEEERAPNNENNQIEKSIDEYFEEKNKKISKKRRRKGFATNW